MSKHKPPLDKLPDNIDDLQSIIFDLKNQNIELEKLLSNKESELNHQLSEKNRQYQTIIENLSDIVYRYKNTLNGEMVFISEGIYSLCGYTSDEFLSNEISYKDIIHPRDRDYVKCLINESFDKNEKFDLEYRIITKNGDTRWVKEKGSSTQPDMSEEIYIEGIITDITKAHKIQKSLEASEHRLRNFFNKMSDAILVQKVTGKTIGKFSDLNEIALNTYGFSPKEFKKLDFFDLIDHSRSFRDPDEEFLVKLSRKPQIFEEYHLTNKKEPFSVEISSNIIELDGQKVILSVVRDISSRKNLEKQIKKSDARFRLLAENSVDFVWSSDLDLNYSFASPSVQKLFGLDTATTETLKITDHYTSFSREVLETAISDKLEIYRKNISSNNPFKLELEAVHNSGAHIWVEVFANFILDKEKKAIGIQGSSRDITEKKKAEKELLDAKEKAEESDRLKTSFLHNISHELRTPMNGIIGFADFLQSPDLPDVNRNQYLNIIRECSLQLLDVMNNILDSSKIETGLLTLEKRNFNINQTLKGIFNQYLAISAEKNLKLNLNLALQDQVANITSDQSKIQRILKNILDNAIKFTHDGVINFGYNIKEDQLEFYVEDTGIGVDEINHKLIFERFRQVDSTHTREKGGTGLGLSISKGLVELMHGAIWVKSKQNEGSTFYFTIPYLTEPGNKPTDIIADRSVHRPSDLTILVVEDEETNYKFLEMLLDEKGYNKIRAKTGEEAIEICFSNSKINLVLMDIQLPGIDGYEATRKIKEHKPNLPVIAQTAYAMENDIESAIKAGCDDHLAKPMEIENFYKMIEKHSQKQLA